MKRLLKFAALAVAITVAAPPASAYAHVTLQPNTGKAGGYTRLDVRVPNELPNANTTKIEVQFPTEFLSVGYEPTLGWNTEVKTVKLDAPITVEGEQKTDRVDTVTFTATGEGVKPNQFQDFGLSLRLPEKPNTTLTFNSIQTYSNGEVVRWIGEPGSEKPAPQVKLIEAPAASDASKEDDDDDDDAVAFAAIGIAILGLLAGLAALVASRRTKQNA